MKLRVQHGLTLIELMIVVAIIAILASVGYPAYQNYVLKAHRTDARAALMEAAEFLERNFAVNGSYTGNGVNFASIQAAALNKYNLANFYAVTAPTLTATTYLLQAASTHTPADTCGTLTINQTGVKTAAAQPGCAW